ncbi:MAG: S49 family peptidase, partial [Actinomycetota bacterium]
MVNTPVNAWRLLRNLFARLFARSPDYVTLEVSGRLPEFETPVNLLRRRLVPGPAQPTLEALRSQLDAILADERPQGIVLVLKDIDAGWASLEELRRELLAFRERGKRVVAYLTGSVDSRGYYLACAAEEILAAPLAVVAVTGVRSRVDFLKDALGRVGVEAEVVAVSPYKSAGDRFARNDFSRESREQAERLLDRRFETLLRAISGGRKMSVEDARKRVDRAPYTAREAVVEGLVDGVCYEDELPRRLGRDGEARVSGWGTARRALRVPYRRSPRRRVGLVEVSGTIVRGRSRKLPVPLPLVGGEQAGSETVVAALRAAEKDRRVSSVLLHVESPGGDALASDLIWREVERINAKKPVVVLMGNAAASGGYYVSAPASHVIARESTITGSIGVLLIRPIAQGLYERLRVNPVVLERGARSNLLDASRRPDADEMRVLVGQVGTIYAEFKERLSRGRKLPETRLEEVCGGRVWTGAEALDLGLVDEVGGFRGA